MMPNGVDFSFSFYNDFASSDTVCALQTWDALQSMRCVQ